MMIKYGIAIRKEHGKLEFELINWRWNYTNNYNKAYKLIQKTPRKIFRGFCLPIINRD